MSQKPNDELKPHSYDGIQEYDNQLPRWWVGTFVLSVVFSLGYWLYYHVYAVGPDLAKEWSVELALHQKEVAAKAGDAPTLSAAETAALIQDAPAMKEAAGLFAQYCAACHGVQAQGVIGPNLTDAHWIHGGKPEAVFTTILKGVPEKGMVAWKGVLKDEQVKKLVAYIASVQGTNPPGAKAPQGEIEK